MLRTISVSLAGLLLGACPSLEAQLPNTDLQMMAPATGKAGSSFEVTLGGDDHATECPFCATPLVTDTGTHRHIKPRAVMPFAFD